MGVRIIEVCDHCGGNMGSSCCTICGAERGEPVEFAVKFKYMYGGEKEFKVKERTYHESEDGMEQERICNMWYNIVRKKCNFGDEYDIGDLDSIFSIGKKIYESPYHLEYTRSFEETCTREGGTWIMKITSRDIKDPKPKGNKYILKYEFYFGIPKVPGTERWDSDY